MPDADRNQHSDPNVPAALRALKCGHPSPDDVESGRWADRVAEQRRADGHLHDIHCGAECYDDARARQQYVAQRIDDVLDDKPGPRPGDLNPTGYAPARDWDHLASILDDLARRARYASILYPRGHAVLADHIHAAANDAERLAQLRGHL